MVIIPRFSAFEKYRENGLQAGRAHGMMRKIKSLEARYEKTLAKELLQFIEKSPSTYHVIENVRRRLLASGYTELEENARWNLVHGGKYFLTRGGTSCIAFRIPEEAARGFMLTASHSDSPSFKLKENPERAAAGHYLQLSTEKIRRNADGAVVRPAAFYRGKSARGHRKRH